MNNVTWRYLNKVWLLPLFSCVPNLLIKWSLLVHFGWDYLDRKVILYALIMYCFVCIYNSSQLTDKILVKNLYPIYIMFIIVLVLLLGGSINIDTLYQNELNVYINQIKHDKVFESSLTGSINFFRWATLFAFAVLFPFSEILRYKFKIGADVL